ncbi:universal stress protein [Dermabacteraceae bacterium TAE3-ERU27]|nr:universal stress protein [Dermabacteraceae bacterium TAE3-ERU27]
MTVLVGFIPTPIGHRALDAALQEAGRTAEPILAVNVLRPRSPQDDPRRASDNDFAYVKEKARSAGIRCEIRTLEAEDVTDALVDVAASEKARLLVIGLRREKAVGRHLMGATSQALLLSAPCDVLTV